MRFLILQEVDSTNSYVSVHAAELEDMTMVIADSQTAGRGQRGNSWESEPGCNLTFTLLVRQLPVEPARQFAISEAVALAVADFLREAGIGAEVKWPNDIYVADRKIAGILIEHSLTGSRIEQTRIGVGLNVNQTEFRSDAPNPVSMAQLTGHRYDISRVAASVGMHLEKRLAALGNEQLRHRLHEEFRTRMWRREGWHRYRVPLTGSTCVCEIADVDPCGPISLREKASGEVKTYCFKEIEFLPDE